MAESLALRQAAREIFLSGLRAADSREAVRRALTRDGSRLIVADVHLDLTSYESGVYAIAIGKAALPMAVALEDTLGEFLRSGFIAGPVATQPLLATLVLPPRKLTTAWRWCEGGHPLPNKTSLLAAKESFDLLGRANATDSLIIFLISGGGSAMIEWPADEKITLADLRNANRQLISCGANIAEINAVRRAFSAVKGGKLAARAPQAKQITLIISDTNRGDEAGVASGPSLRPPVVSPEARDVINRYHLEKNLPASILTTIRQAGGDAFEAPKESGTYYVLLDNQTAIEAAAARAMQFGFTVETAGDISEQAIDEGSSLLVSRLRMLRERARGNPVCLLSGGEFSCPVIGDGIGGRNLETALRCAMEFDRVSKSGEDTGHMIALSAGTDGIDGNSPAAGAIADETSIRRGRVLNLDAEGSLLRSDSFGFFNSLGDAITTGPTGTNVRDLRILLASE